MKWIFFFVSLSALFVANNGLFLLPGHYDFFNFVAAGVAIFLAVLFALVKQQEIYRICSVSVRTVPC